MRIAAATIVLASAALAQFRSTVPLVVAPTTVTDSKGHFVDGLTPEDVVLYDDNVPQTILMDWTVYPISLVVAVQAGANAGTVIDKLGGSGILFSGLLAGDGGETAVIAFSDEVKVRQDFTADPDRLTGALRMLRKDGGGARMLDALLQAAAMLERRPPGRRRIILMIAEKRDRGSAAKLPEVVERIERINAAVYWLAYSPFMQPFTAKSRTAEDLKPEAERIKVRKCPLCPGPDDTPVPNDLGPGGIIYALGELGRLNKPDLASLFARTTGGRTMGFLKKNRIGERDSGGGRRGAPAVHPELRAESRRAGQVSHDPRGGSGPARASGENEGGLLGAGAVNRSAGRAAPSQSAASHSRHTDRIKSAGPAHQAPDPQEHYGGRPCPGRREALRKVVVQSDFGGRSAGQRAC